MEEGLFEPEESRLFRELMPRFDAFVDVGANIGFYSCMARHFGVEAVAIEPLHTNLRWLLRNLEANGWNDTEVIPCGLGPIRGIGRLYGGGTGASLVPGWASASASAYERIPITTLDHVLALQDEGARLLIKVDVEGSELGALRGAERTLRRRVSPVWVVEICLTEHRPGGVNPDYLETFSVFFEAGYSAAPANDPTSRITPVQVEAWVSDRFCALGTHNFLFRREG